MKFKVGELVQIKNWNYLKNGYNTVIGMRDTCGMIGTIISEISPGDNYKVSFEGHNYTFVYPEYALEKVKEYKFIISYDQEGKVTAKDTITEKKIVVTPTSSNSSVGELSKCAIDLLIERLKKEDIIKENDYVTVINQEPTLLEYDAWANDFLSYDLEPLSSIYHWDCSNYPMLNGVYKVIIKDSSEPEIYYIYDEDEHHGYIVRKEAIKKIN